MHPGYEPHWGKLSTTNENTYDLDIYIAIREGAKFIGLHQGQRDRGAKSFWEEKNDGANTFSEEKMTGQTLFWAKKMTGLGLFYRKRMTGRRCFCWLVF